MEHPHAHEMSQRQEGGKPFDHLLSVWPQIRQQVLAAPGVLVGLDYDGTLSPIAPRPELAMTPPDTTEALQRLAALPEVEVAIVSGRGVGDLASRVGLPQLTYVGNHGLEIQRPGTLWRHPDAVAAEVMMADLRGRLEIPVEECPGAVLDFKGLTLSVHFRLVADESRIRKLLDSVREAARPMLERGDVRIGGGKMVMEVRPRVNWGKGHAMALLLAGETLSPDLVVLDERGAYTGPTDGRLPLYVGDDVTDEDAFRVLARAGITARVGPPDEPTAAAYWLSSPREVCDLLITLSDDLEAARRR